jgi:hypothetical protein
MLNSDFMISLISNLQKVRGINESSATAYIYSLYSLNGKKSFKNLAFLKNYETIENILSGYAENTQKNYLAAIVSVLCLFENKRPYGIALRYWREKMNTKSNEIDDNTKKGEMSEKQKAAYISWADVNKRQDELRAAAMAVKGKAISQKEFDSLLANVVLSLYTNIPPRRNDYSNMYVIRKKSESTADTSKNYLDIPNKKFIFNVFKTVKKHGQQTADINELLMNDIKLYLKHTGNNEKFLVLQNGQEINKTNGLTRLLNKIFAPKKISSSLLRHIFLTEKFGENSEAAKVDAEREHIANAMGHTTAMQREYVFSDVPDSTKTITDVPDSPKNSIVETPTKAPRKTRATRSTRATEKA